MPRAHVTGSDGLDDQEVLARSRTQSRAVVARHAAEPDEVRPQAAQGADEVGVARGLVDRGVEPGDEVVVAGVVGASSSAGAARNSAARSSKTAGSRRWAAWRAICCSSTCRSSKSCTMSSTDTAVTTRPRPRWVATSPSAAVGRGLRAAGFVRLRAARTARPRRERCRVRVATRGCLHAGQRRHARWLAYTPSPLLYTQTSAEAICRKELARCVCREGSSGGPCR